MDWIISDLQLKALLPNFHLPNPWREVRSVGYDSSWKASTHNPWFPPDAVPFFLLFLSRIDGGQKSSCNASPPVTPLSFVSVISFINQSSDRNRDRDGHEFWAINNPATTTNPRTLCKCMCKMYILLLASDHSFFTAIGEDSPFPPNAYCLSWTGKSFPVDYRKRWGISTTPTPRRVYCCCSPLTCLKPERTASLAFSTTLGSWACEGEINSLITCATPLSSIVIAISQRLLYWYCWSWIPY